MSPSQSHTLEQRHKLSLSRFAEKTACIQDWITQLESTILPTLEELDEVYDATVLEDAWKQHKVIDEETQRLDSGELRSLRLLAKAASQKELNGEDTDLIEITLTSLFSLDKLLHLLRQRNKTLHLLQARITWNKKVQQVEKDFAALIQDGLPRFLSKARWTQPRIEASKPRLSSGFSGSSPSSSPTSLRGTTTSSAMARQMRSEILSLDLASLTSRIHTLLYSTLSSSGKTLDVMIDSSPTPIPEKYLDSQDELELRIKDGLKGVGEFCSQLAKQWREADEIYWTSMDEISSLEGLERETNEATLKVPSKERAEGFEERLGKSRSTLERLSDKALKRLGSPIHPIQVPDQNKHNEVVRIALGEVVDKTSASLACTEQVVQSYRSAVTALAEALEYQGKINRLTQEIKAQLASISTISLDPSCLDLAPDDGQANTSLLETLSSLVRIADVERLPEASDILLALQKAGIDPNIRRTLHDGVLALSSISKEAKAFVESENRMMKLRNKAREVWGMLREQRETANKDVGNLLEAIQISRWREDVAPPASAALLAGSLSVPGKEATRNTDQLLRELEDSLSESGQSLLQKLRNERKAVQEAEEQRIQLVDLHRRVLKQASIVEEVREEHKALVERMQSYLNSLQEADYTMDNLESHQSQQKTLVTQGSVFTSSLATRVPFVSAPDSPSELGLDRTDTAVRACVNQLASELGSLGDESKASLQEFEAAVQSTVRLNALTVERNALQDRLENTANQALAERHASLVSLQAEVVTFTASLPQPHIPSTPNHLSSTALADLQSLHSNLSSSCTSLQTTIQDRLEATEAEMSAAQAAQAEDRRQQEMANVEALRRRKLEEEVRTLEREVQDLRTRWEECKEKSGRESGKVAEQTFGGELEEEAVLEAFESSAKYLEQESDELRSQVEALADRSRELQLTTADDDLRDSIATLESSLSETSAALLTQLQSSSQCLALATERHKVAVTERREREEVEARQQLVQEVTVKLDEAEADMRSDDQALLSLQDRLTHCTTISEIEEIAIPLSPSAVLDEQVEALTRLLSSIPASAYTHAGVAPLEERLQAVLLSQSAYVDKHSEVIAAKASKLAFLQAEEEERTRQQAEAEEAAHRQAQEDLAREAKERADIEDLLGKFQQAEIDVLALEEGVKDLKERFQLDDNESPSLHSSVDLASSRQPRLVKAVVDLNKLMMEAKALEGNVKFGSDPLKDDIQHALACLSQLTGQLEAVQQTKDDLVETAERKIEEAKEATVEAPDAAPAALRHSRQTTEDVFGPEVYTTDSLTRSATATSLNEIASPSSVAEPLPLSPSMLREASSALLEIEAAVNELNFDRFLRPLPKSVSQQLLPSLQEAQAAQRQISLAHAHLDDISASLEDTEDQTKLVEINKLVQQRTREASLVMQLASFAAAAEKTDNAISELLDAIDEKENDLSAEAVSHASQMVEQMKESGRPFADDPRVTRRMEQLEEIWLELRSLAQREQFASPSMSRSMSRASSIASDLSTLSRRSVSAYHHPRSASRISNVSTPRLPSSTSSSRIPVASSPRVRTRSTASVSKPSLSKLPVPSSPAIPGGFLAPRSSSRKSSRDTTRSPAPPTPLLRKSLSNANLPSPPGSRRSSNRRISGVYKPDVDDRPNHYRPNSKRKLDVAVGRIVNTMNVPVTITPAEAFQDLSGKYWIGDPPKLYYARILRSKTVMLRVGGGWQELGSFLTTHHNAVFSTHAQHTSPLQSASQQDSPSSDANRSWLSASALKASLPTHIPTSSSHVHTEKPTPRAVSHDHRYALSRTISNGSKDGTPIDLTSLLVKSTSRPSPTAGINTQQRSKSASIPWRI